MIFFQHKCDNFLFWTIYTKSSVFINIYLGHLSIQSVLHRTVFFKNSTMVYEYSNCDVKTEYMCMQFNIH